jgi:hypothetical protein
MKAVIVFLLVVMFQGLASAQEVSILTGAWMPVNMGWQHAPANVAPRLQTAGARILYFQPDGNMIAIGCLVYREPGKLTMGPEGILETGDWHVDHGRIVTHTRVALREVQRKGETLPGPWKQDVWTLEHGVLSRGGIRYRRAPELDKSAAELVPRPIPTRPHY